MNARAEAPLAAADWAEHNQHWLVAEMARLRRLITLRLADGAAPDTPVGASNPETPPTAWTGPVDTLPALRQIAHRFGLSPFEQEVLLLAAGVELDRDLRALLPGGLSFSLAMSLLGSARIAPHWDALSPQAPLRDWQLVHTAAALPAHAPLAIDERVLHAITGVTALDDALRGMVRQASDAPAADATAAARLAAALASLDAAQPMPLVLFALEGGAAAPSAACWRDTAACAVQAIGQRALLLALEDLPIDAREADALARRFAREAALGGGLPVLWGETDAARRVAAFADSLRSATIVAAPLDRARLRATLQRPLSIVAWTPAQAAPPEAGTGADMLRPALQQFRVDAATLRSAVAQLDPEATLAVRSAALWSALRDTTRGGLDALAQRIVGTTGFADLVLPPAQLVQLRGIATQLRLRHTVHDDWGFAARGRRGLGIAALFTGESGTGKTMAAEAIANEAQLDLYRIDLAATVSKYIGETEKNLSRLFDAAEASGAVLLFDEADALFGKRSEVKDSHDRYANIEIAYLLQRIESYRGLAILTTNLKGSLDKAFLRRIRFVVQFPFPDAALRERLWQLQLPAAAPRGAIDFAALGRAPLAGGHIRSAALQAAFDAAAQGRAIDTELLTQAMRAEFAKLERTMPGERT